jgi:hypothetical protein
MDAQTQTDRASALLESVRPELLKLLGGCPQYGSVGLDIVLHEGEIARVVTRMEVQRKPRIGGRA